MFTILMNINGKSVLVKVTATTCEGLEGVILKFRGGTEIVYPEASVNEMVAAAQALASGKRTKYVPA
tara:strand:- start:124 stop:324 length:201 start_codon:yes stop_codon:yes gene_type:complete